MTTATPVEIGSLLYMMPSPAGGRVCISGSGVSVKAVGALHAQGFSPEEILDEYPHLTLPGIYAALAYYLANQQLFEAQLKAEREIEDAIIRHFPDGWRNEPLPPEIQDLLDGE